MKERTFENQIELRDCVDFKVDSEKCLHCGLCVRDCAFKVLSLNNDGLPTMAHPEKCMRCQHRILPDMIEVGSFIGMAAMCGECVRIKNVSVKDLRFIGHLISAFGESGLGDHFLKAPAYEPIA